MNLIINYCWGNKLFKTNDFQIYLQSLDKIEDTEKILLVKDCDFEELKKIAHHYDKIIGIDNDILYLDQVFYNFLCSSTENYEYVLICDSRDIIFQKNPFEYMKYTNKSLYLVSEGMKVTDSAPNYEWMIRLNKTQWQLNDIGFNNFVLNGGCIGGKIEHVILLIMISFTNTNRNSKQDIFNQTVYTYIEYFLRSAKFVEICHPQDSLYCITGEGVGKHGVPMKIVDGLACNENDEPYYIVHQWDRTFFANEVRNRYIEGRK